MGIEFKSIDVRRLLCSGLTHLGVWLLVMSIFAGQLALSSASDWKQAIGYALHYWGPWLVLSPLALYLAGRIPLRRSHWLGSGMAHAGLSLLFAFATQAIVIFAIGPLLTDDFRAPQRRPQMAAPSPFPPTHPPRPHRGPPPLRHHRTDGDQRSLGSDIVFGAMSRMPIWIPLYWILVGFRTLQRTNKELLRREHEALDLKSRLTQARLDTLKLQLRPHFLFNALNAVSTLVHSDPDKADEMIGNLSLLLRRVLEVENVDTVTLRDEMDFTRAYLDLEKIRFGDRFQFTEAIADECWECTLPVMLLQPIFENAIRHGLEPLSRDGAVHIAGDIRKQRLTLQIEDNGVGRQANTRGGTGVGLSNAKARLENVYGSDQYSLEINDRDGGGTVVTITIPSSEK